MTKRQEREATRMPLVYYICHGSGDQALEELEDLATTGGETTWTINSRARPGDMALFYLSAPISSIVARGEVRSKPERQNDRRKNWFGHYMSVLGGIRMLGKPVPLDELAGAFPNWGWPRSPITSTRLPDHVAERITMRIGEDDLRGSGSAPQLNGDGLPPDDPEWYSVDEYVQAIEKAETRISPAQKQMLSAHAESPDLVLSVSQLAAAAGYDTAQVTYSQYGRLGHLLAEVLNHEGKEAVWTRLIGLDWRAHSGDVMWTMEPSLARALVRLGWATRTNAHNALAEIEAAGLSDIPETTRQAIVQSRLGQGPFRNALISKWGCCAVTGIAHLDVLRASHIKPWKVASNEERLDRHNGLLLAAHLDALFDVGLITFDHSGAIQISRLLPSPDRRKLRISKALRLTHLDKETSRYLAYHRQYVFKS